MFTIHPRPLPFCISQFPTSSPTHTAMFTLPQPPMASLPSILGRPPAHASFILSPPPVSRLPANLHPNCSDSTLLLSLPSSSSDHFACLAEPEIKPTKSSKTQTSRATRFFNLRTKHQEAGEELTLLCVAPCFLQASTRLTLLDACLLPSALRRLWVPRKGERRQEGGSCHKPGIVRLQRVPGSFPLLPSEERGG